MKLIHGSLLQLYKLELYVKCIGVGLLWLECFQHAASDENPSTCTPWRRKIPLSECITSFTDTHYRFRKQLEHSLL